MNPAAATPLSFYVLTFNNATQIQRLLTLVRPAVDDMLVLDSGSTDQTVALAQACGARVLSRPLDDFASQRRYAVEQCRHDWVFSLDSDELPDAQFVSALQRLKADHFHLSGSLQHAFKLKRDWYVGKRRVHALYPVKSPDYPIRLFHRAHMAFDTQSNRVHERPFGVTQFGLLEGSVAHYALQTLDELPGKLARYTPLAAQDAHTQGKRGTCLKQLLHSTAAFVKFYFAKKNMLDGALGLRLAWYAAQYTWQKYALLRKL